MRKLIAKNRRPKGTQIAADAVIVIFDGECGFCDRMVRWLHRRDRNGRLRFASAQSDIGRALLGAVGIHASAPVLESVVVLRDNRAFIRSDAVIELARNLHGAGRMLIATAILPRGLREALYRAFAARRYRWFGRADACAPPDPPLRARFLDGGLARDTEPDADKGQVAAVGAAARNSQERQKR